MSDNHLIIDEFNKLINQIKTEIDNSPSSGEARVHSFRLKQVRNVLEAIKKYNKPITRGEDLQDIKGVGKHSIDRINEILKTGKLSEIKKNTQSNDFSKYIDELKNIIGIGPRSAYELVTVHNIKSVDQLIKAHKNKRIQLNSQVLLGLKYHNVYKQNIPRQEIDQIYNYVATYAKKCNPDLHIIICGSYRRLKMTSNDIDILITHPKIKTKHDIQTKKNYLILLVNALRKAGFLLDDLTDKFYEKKYMGFCQLDKNHDVRRIDIRYVPYESYYAAILYFTGSGPFNQKMRLIAKQMGYKLNEYGIYDNNGKKISIKSEKDIFDALGMEYLPPEQRI